MTSGRLDAYLSRLERELRQRGFVDARMIEEARDHLVDAVEDGRARGLSVEEAERDAFERFGAPETVAAHADVERGYRMIRFTAVLETVWHRKWWILAPTVLTAIVTSVMSYNFLPTGYRSESVIRHVVPRVPAEDARSASTDRPHARLQQISQRILSRTQLERLINDFDLDQIEHEGARPTDLVLQMRRNISVNFLTSEHAQPSDVDEFSVSFVSPDPKVAMKITERLARLIIEEYLRETEAQAMGASRFIDSQIADVRRRLIAYESTLDNLRAQNGRRTLSQADLLPYDVLQDHYKALLIKAEKSRIDTNRQRSGEQLVLIDPARVPEQPLGPSRLRVNVVGTFAGLSMGLVLVGLRGRSKDHEDTTSATAH